MAFVRRVTSLTQPGHYPRLVLMVMASVLLLSGCMLSPLFQAPAAVMTGIAVLLGLAACSGGGGGGGGGSSDTTTPSNWPAVVNLGVLQEFSGLGLVLVGEDTTTQGFGFSLSAGRDVDGDGNNDLVIGAPFENSQRGAAFVVFGGGHLTTMATVTYSSYHSVYDLADVNKIVKLVPSDSYGHAGYSVLLAPNISGDGLADVVVGAPGYTYSTYGGAGRVWVLSGNANLPPTSSGSILTLPMTYGGSDTTFNGTDGLMIGSYSTSFSNSLGVSLAAGDLNGDGKADLLMGAPVYGSPHKGHVTVLMGKYASSNNGIVEESYLHSTTSSHTWMYGANTEGGSNAGQSMAIGRINGDGVDDALIGAPLYQDGVAFVVFGKSGGNAASLPNFMATMNASQGWQFIGYYDQTYLGTYTTSHRSYHNAADQVGKVVVAGDLDNGGQDDVIIAARHTYAGSYYSASSSTPSNSYTYSADRVFIVFSEGLPTGSDGVVNLDSVGSHGAQIVLPNDTTVTALNASVDINGDGYKDLIIGVAPNNFFSGYNQVIAYVVFGGPNLHGASIYVGEMGSSQGFTVIAHGFYGEGTTTYNHVSITSGDVNGDGKPDVILGVEGYGAIDHTAGSVYIIFGLRSGATFPEPPPE